MLQELKFVEIRPGKSNHPYFVFQVAGKEEFTYFGVTSLKARQIYKELFPLSCEWDNVSMETKKINDIDITNLSILADTEKIEEQFGNKIINMTRINRIIEVRL